MTTISLKVPDSLDAKLAAEAKRRGMTKAAVIRERIEKSFAEQSASTPRFMDLARDLAGCLDGPRDIATNPQYMDGFGL